MSTVWRVVGIVAGTGLLASGITWIVIRGWRKQWKDSLSTNGPKVVLQVIPTLATKGGVERTVVDVALELSSTATWSSIVVSSDKPGDIPNLSGKYIRKSTVSSKNPFLVIWSGFALARLIAREGVSIVHARSRVPAWSCWLAVWLLGIQGLITTVAGVGWTGKSSFKTWAAKSIWAHQRGAVETVSMFAAQCLTSVTPGISIVRVPEESGLLKLKDHKHPVAFVNHRGVDFEAADAALAELKASEGGESEDSSQQLATHNEVPGVGDDERDVHVIIPGRITAWKGQVDFLKALLGVRVEEEMKDRLRIVIMGAVTSRREHRDLMCAVEEANNAGYRVEYRQGVELEAVPKSMARFDIVVVPSKQPESFGRVPLEALALKRPVVAFRHGGVSETCERVPGVWLIEPRRGQWGLVKAVVEIASKSSAERLELATKGREEIQRRRYGKAAMMRRQMALYESFQATE